MAGKLQIRDKRKGEAVAKGLLKKRKRVQADTEIGIEGAGKRLEKLERRIEELEGEVALLRAQTADVWAWWKNTQEVNDESITH